MIPSIRIQRIHKMLIILVPLLLLIASCERDFTNPEEPSFSLEPKYPMIRSYPGGGGIFLIRLVPNAGFSGTITLSVEANDLLHAEILQNLIQLGDSAEVAEITLHPDTLIPIQTYDMVLSASSGSHVEQATLQIEMCEWEANEPSEEAIGKRDAFIPWLIQNVPGCGELDEQTWDAYMTYPEILVVEHWTFLCPDWELRMCFHVTVQPYDWSKVWLRRRGEFDPVVTAMRESDGTIHTIPEVEYPTFSY